MINAVRCCRCGESFKFPTDEMRMYAICSGCEKPPTPLEEAYRLVRYSRERMWQAGEVRRAKVTMDLLEAMMDQGLMHSVVEEALDEVLADDHGKTPCPLVRRQPDGSWVWVTPKPMPRGWSDS